MTTRRDFIKKTAYTAPVIMTLGARPSFAGQGSSDKNGGNRSRQQRRREDVWSWLRGLLGLDKKKG